MPAPIGSNRRMISVASLAGTGGVGVICGLPWQVGFTNAKARGGCGRCRKGSALLAPVQYGVLCIMIFFYDTKIRRAAARGGSSQAGLESGAVLVSFSHFSHARTLSISFSLSALQEAGSLVSWLPPRMKIPDSCCGCQPSHGLRYLTEPTAT